MRVLTFGILGIASFALGSPPAAAQSTTRIETRPFYGATVTIEAGVRVFRPLPAHDRVIINPGGKTPLFLGIEEHRHTNYNQNNSYNNVGAAPSDGSGGAFFPGGHRGRGGHHGGHRGR